MFGLAGGVLGDYAKEYIKDLIDYIKLKEGNRLLINLKNIKKTSQYKRRVFNKGNSEIIKEIDNFYSA